MHISHHTAAQAFDLSGTRMLITGAAGGIGSATARLCNQLGATLVLSDFGQQAKLEELAQQLKGVTAVESCDVTDRIAVGDDSTTRSVYSACRHCGNLPVRR